jgi:hypothetical protein
MSFDIETFLKGIKIEDHQETLQHAKDACIVEELAANDPWLARAAHFGVAGAMQRHIIYVGGTLLDNAQQKLTRMSSEGVMGESYVQDHWFGNTNENEDENPHVSNEVPFDVQIEKQQNFVEELEGRILRGGIMMVTRIKFHDDLSLSMSPRQKTYDQIQASSSAKNARTNLKVVAENV